MRTSHKCVAIMRRIVELVNADEQVAFTRDWGGNSLTVFTHGTHAHVGDPDGSFESMVDSLYHTLHADGEEV